VAFVPVTNSVAVPTDVTFRVTFDDYPDPDTVRSSTLLLTTGYFWVPGTYGVDLIGKAAVMQPIRSLVPQLGYGLHLRPALSSLAGCPGTSVDIMFITGDGPTGEPPPEPPAFAATIQPLFEARCGGGCHLGPEDSAGCLSSPAAGLSLCAADSWDGLVGVRSSQSDKLQLVEPGDSARSYLLRKLLPTDAPGGRLPGVQGQREPPGEPLSEDQLRLIAAWIDGGALR
jgi:Bacterial Ig-like domain